MQESIKLQAYLAHAGVSSRRGAEQLIADGFVTVNGKSAHIGQRVQPTDIIKFKGKTISATSAHEYFVVHKPPGLVSTTNDEMGRDTVLSLLPENKRPGLYPVGRLDQDSEGLLLLTNDGELTFVLTHPKFEIEKTYHVLLQGVPSTPALEHLRRGIKLDGEYIKPVKISILRHENKNTWLEVIISEGKKHQVKRMMNRTGYEVIKLVRVKMGPLELGALQKGEYRELSEIEKKDLTTLKKTTKLLSK